MTLYRYSDWAIEGGVKVGLYAYYNLRETPKGYWILENGGKRWVSKTSKKRYAYPTIEEAAASFKARKRRQSSIHFHLHDKAEACLRMELPTQPRTSKESWMLSESLD